MGPALYGQTGDGLGCQDVPGPMEEAMGRRDVLEASSVPGAW